MCVKWRHLVNACEVKAHLIRCWQYPGAVCFWQPTGISSGLNLFVVAVLSNSLCRVIACVADCYMSYNIVCKVERFVLTN